MENKERFLKVYANLPMGLRGDIIFVTATSQPISWNAAFVEVSGGTELGCLIINSLIDLNII
jgi:hypothetical protein